MAAVSLPHPSSPGYYGQRFSEATRRALATVVDVLIPAGDGYPAASDAGVVDYVQARCSAQDAEMVGALCVPAAEAADVQAHLEALELSEPEAFAWLLQFAYHGYYASSLVIGTLNVKGYDYHGAPQPFGYVVDEVPPTPSGSRGSYIPTEEVRRVV